MSFQGRDPALTNLFQKHYPNYPLAAREGFVDASLVIGRNPTLSSHWFSTRVIKTEDGEVFTTFPVTQMLAHLEWTLNWAISSRSHYYLLMHAGVLARGEHALVLPAIPGAGKTTLCAYLMYQGWRLLSDEFVLIEDRSLQITPFPRLMPLKNESIAVIRDLIPDAKLGPLIPETHKGNISHLQPRAENLREMHLKAVPRLMLFPRFVAGAALKITPASKPECFIQTTQNAFNYVLKGREGFELAAAITNQVEAYHLEYSDLPEAAAAIWELMDKHAPDG